ncbi:MAG: hypothetical protein ACYC0X_12265 [Pirellulaceae bacterium]
MKYYSSSQPFFDRKNGRKRTRREPSIYKWLRDRTSGIDYGFELRDEKGKHPIHLNRNEEVLAHFARLRDGNRSWLSRISNLNFLDHFTNAGTFFFAGAAEPKKPETLVLIDIDCKKTGTLDGAMAFAEFLKNEHFPNLYIEVSTHGNGAHGFFVLEKCDFGAEPINDLLLRRLQSWLRQILKERDFDVENVEIKGTLPVVVWGDQYREVTNYRSGTLAKLPRLGTPDKENALRKTTKLTVYDLMRLPIVEKEKKARVAKAGPQIVGSICGKAISDEELKTLGGPYREVGETLLEAHKLETAGRTVVRVEDIAIFLLLLKFFTNNMNGDGSLPVERFKKMWQALYEAGDVDRAFCPQRFKVIRDYLSSLGLLDWQDETYCLGWYEHTGEYHKGKACKWRAGEQLMAMLKVDHQATDNKGEREEASFIRTKVHHIVESIVPKNYKATKRPVLLESVTVYRYSVEEITRFIAPFEEIAEIAA